MLTREDYIDVHALRRPGWTISAIARQLGHDRKIIRAYHLDELLLKACASVPVVDAGGAHWILVRRLPCGATMVA